MKNSNFLTSKISQFKGIIAGAALSIMALSAQAQDFPGTAFGVKGGLNLTNFAKNDNITDEKIRAGFNAGIYGRFKLTDGFSLQPEVIYSTQGNKQTYSTNFIGNSPSSTATIDLGYVQVPILAVVNIVPNFNIHAGPYAGFLVKNKYTSDNNNGNSSSNDINSDYFNKVDFGLVGGIGIDITKVHIGARYLYGLQNVGADKDFGIFGTHNLFPQKNNGIQLYVAFDLK